MKGIKLFTNLLFTALMAMLIASFTNLPVVALFGALVVLSVLTPKHVAFMAITREIWEADIVENLFTNNNFAERAFNADQYVQGGAVVHIPFAGAASASLKNPTDFPITAVQRTDTDVIYGIDKYFQAPKYVQNVEQAELAYDKRQSIMGEQMKQLIQDAMEGLLYNWGWKTPNTIGTTAGNFVPTVGAATATDIPAGATGSRLTFTKAVFGSIKKAMDVANIPSDGRVALLSAYHYQQFIDSLSDIEQTNFYRTANMQTGVVGSYLGFEFMMRSTVQQWRYAAGVWAPVDTQAAGFAASDKSNDSFASLIYQEKCVERARGDVKVFEDANRPEYFGDVFSMNMRLGGRQRRAAGVYAVVDAIA